MINKKYFIEILEQLKTTNDFVNETNEKIIELREKLNNDFIDGNSLGIFHEDIVVSLLDIMFKTDMITYWVYELDYGRGYKDGCVQDEEGNNIDISTAEKMYDYLVEGMKEKEK